MLQGRPGDLRRIDNARFDEVLEVAGLCIEAEIRFVVQPDLLDYDCAFVAGIEQNLMR